MRPGVTMGSETIRPVRSTRDVERARALFVEYAAWLKVDLCFQDFERELAMLPGAYAPPLGRLLLAGSADDAFGCIALRPLAASHSSGTERAAGEVKRLYVQPARRGEGWGERLAQELLREAQAAGYGELKLDTLAWMSEARALYARLGFRQCAPYYDNPLDGAVYMSLTLAHAAQGDTRANSTENHP
jgi:ribosomal protein S18 acetylase RimI-like enzyme